jgi:hypothetical protein
VAGGNDWALDDLSVATCLPNMSYSPTINPVSCANNAVQVHDTIRSYLTTTTILNGNAAVMVERHGWTLPGKMAQ